MRCRRGYTFIVALGAISVLSGFAIYKPVQLSWLTTLFGGFEFRALLALRGGVALHRVHHRACRCRAAGRPRVASFDDHRVVSRKVSQP